MKEQYFQQPSVTSAQSHFAKVPAAEIQRSRFDRSHGLKTTFDAGLLCPIFVDEVLPGDTFTLNQTAFARLATPLKPIMDNIKLDTHFFFVPYRLIWDNWQQFMGERRNPDDDPTLLSIPQTEIDLTSIDPASLPAYFGLPLQPAATAPVSVSALPFRAYMLIWNEWYRDQNLQDRIDVPVDDGPDTWDNSLPLRRGKRHDYFTSCLPWPQKGDPVLIPLGDQADLVFPSGLKTNPIYMDQIHTGSPNFLGNLHGAASQWAIGLNSAGGAFAAGADPAVNLRSSSQGDSSFNIVGQDTAYADLSTATAVSINDLRTAFQIQRLLERDARGGTRYIELILSHFGVKSDDARLQRPEYLGGDSSNISVNPVASTAQTTTLPQGNLSAIGTGINRSGFQKSFTEHGIIIGLVSARADLTYQQGIDRFWSRETRYDFYWPALAHTGEQAVLNKEIYATGGASDNDVFGYQERYAEYRYKPSRLTGLMASNAAASLDVWHLGIDFASLPALNASFIEDNPPIDRVIAVSAEPHFLLDVWFDLKTDRPMPVYSVPGLIDHF